MMCKIVSHNIVNMLNPLLRLNIQHVALFAIVLNVDSRLLLLVLLNWPQFHYSNNLHRFCHKHYWLHGRSMHALL